MRPETTSGEGLKRLVYEDLIYSFRSRVYVVLSWQWGSRRGYRAWVWMFFPSIFSFPWWKTSFLFTRTPCHLGFFFINFLICGVQVCLRVCIPASTLSQSFRGMVVWVTILEIHNKKMPRIEVVVPWTQEILGEIWKFEFRRVCRDSSLCNLLKQLNLTEEFLCLCSSCPTLHYSVCVLHSNYSSCLSVSVARSPTVFLSVSLSVSLSLSLWTVLINSWMILGELDCFELSWEQQGVELSWVEYNGDHRTQLNSTQAPLYSKKIEEHLSTFCFPKDPSFFCFWRLTSVVRGTRGFLIIPLKARANDS